MNDDRHVIWNNYDLNFDDWRDELRSEYPDMPESRLEEMMYERNGEYLDDERVNLNISLQKPILVIADLGLWHGRCSGYKEIKSGNIADCLYSNTDYSTWFVDKYGDMRCDAVHHDGTNHYLYRVYKDSITEDQADRLKDKIYNGTATHNDIARYTRRLGDEIGRVYGWNFPQHPPKRDPER